MYLKNASVNAMNNRKEIEQKVESLVTSIVHINNEARGRNWLVLELTDFIMEREKKLHDALDDIDRYLFMRGPMRDKNHWVKAKKGYNKYIHNITRKSLGYKEER